jgi:alcohol dehydrogenase
MGETRAAVFSGEPGKIYLRTFATPVPTGSEILVEVLACSLCGSDRHTFEGRRMVAVPTILGHETLGQIAALGPRAPRVDFENRPLKVGDRVCWAIVAHCGKCPNCLRGLPQKCLAGVKYGHEAIRPGAELRGGGGLADHCLLAEGTSLVRIPEDLTADVVCPAGCATATVCAAVEAAGDLAGRTVAIFGAGLLGLTACSMARVKGASSVICVEPDAGRRQPAARFGATQTVPPGELSDPRLDVVLELSGAPEAFEAALPAMSIGGTIVLLGGVFPSRTVGVAMEDVIRRILTIRGVHNYAPRHLAQAVRFLDDHHHEYPFDSAVVSWFRLAEVHRAFEHARDPRALRVGVIP